MVFACTRGARFSHAPRRLIVLMGLALGLAGPAAIEPQGVYADDANEGGFRFSDAEGRLSVFEGKRPVLVYNYGVQHKAGVPEDRARALGIELVELHELFRQADFITVHTTLTAGTRGLIAEEEIAQMKPSVRLINTARGGIIDEAALLEAVRSGRVAGAAVDVFSQEPAPETPLAGDDRIIVTPHLGASTAEAQERVAVDVAAQIMAVLRGEPAAYAVNAPMVAPETMSVLSPYLASAELVGSLATQLSEGQLRSVEVAYTGDLALHDTTVLRAAVIRGLLKPVSEGNISVVNANLVAEQRGLHIVEFKDPAGEDGLSAITVTVQTASGRTSVAGGVEHGLPHILSLYGQRVDLTPSAGFLLLCDNTDRPGMIGAVGTRMGAWDINISAMKVGRREARGHALMVLELDDEPSEAQVREIESIPGIEWARLVRL